MKPFLYRIKVGSMALLGAFLALLINRVLVEFWLIPDPCYYHAHAASVWVEAMYDFPAGNGYHPTASLLNLGTTALVGIGAGLLAVTRFLRKGIS